MSAGWPGGRLVLWPLLVLASALPAAAQPADWPGRLEIAGSIGWTGGYPVGSSAATLTRNLVPTGDRFTLFRAEIDVESAPAVGARLGWRLTPVLAVEAELSYARAPVRVTLDGDAAGVPAQTFTGERLEQYSLGASVLVRPARLAFAGGRGRIFLLAGASYVRQLHEGRAAIEHARAYQAGTGAGYLLWSRPGRLRGLGLRGDVRYRVQERGFELEGRRRPSAAASAALAALF